MPHWSQPVSSAESECPLRLKWARRNRFSSRPSFRPASGPRGAGFTLFDTGINSIQTLFTSTIARAASLIAIVIGGYSFAHGDPGAKKSPRRRRGRHGYRRAGSECPELALGVWSQHPPSQTAELLEGIVPDRESEPSYRVFKSLHKPLTYLGVERSLFFWCVSRSRLLQSLQFRFGRHSGLRRRLPLRSLGDNTDPASFAFSARAERNKPRYDAAKQQIPNVEVH